jgi:hypothetical protein
MGGYVATTVFVFGSNLAGRHGKGAALEAYKNWGAIYGMGHGRQGNSYAIPTKGLHLEVLPLHTINYFVQEFLEYAVKMPGNIFKLTAIACGLAGYKPEQIAPMFETAPRTIILPEEFLLVLNGQKDE